METHHLSTFCSIQCFTAFTEFILIHAIYFDVIILYPN